MTVVNFRAAEDRLADQMADQMVAIVEGHQTVTGIQACLETLAFLIVGYGVQHGDTDGLAHRCAAMLSSRVAELAEDVKRAAVEQAPEATA